jgi:hypothetical protein
MLAAVDQKGATSDYRGADRLGLQRVEASNIRDLTPNFCDTRRQRRVPKVRRNNIRPASCRTDFPNRFLPALRIVAHDDDMDAEPGQFIRGRPANPARPACDGGIQ